MINSSNAKGLQTLALDKLKKAEKKFPNLSIDENIKQDFVFNS
jgi:hypothetical protein